MALVMPVNALMTGGMGTRIDQALELAEHLATADLDGTELSDVVAVRAAARRLEIDHDEGHPRLKGAEVVERPLDRPGEDRGARSSLRGAGQRGGRRREDAER